MRTQNATPPRHVHNLGYGFRGNERRASNMGFAHREVSFVKSPSSLGMVPVGPLPHRILHSEHTRLCKSGKAALAAIYFQASLVVIIDIFVIHGYIYETVSEIFSRGSSDKEGGSSDLSSQVSPLGHACSRGVKHAYPRADRISIRCRRSTGEASITSSPRGF